MSFDENTPGPVPYTRGPSNWPVSTMSRYARMSVVAVCGSRVVVTPNARFARYSQIWFLWMFHAGQMCAWMSTMPGMIVLPDTSMIFAPAGILTAPRRPTLSIRLSRTTMSPFSMTSLPFMVMIRAPRSATTPDGFARAASTTISVSTASYGGFFRPSSFFSAPSPSFCELSDRHARRVGAAHADRRRVLTADKRDRDHVHLVLGGDERVLSIGSHHHLVDGTWFSGE